MLQISEINGMDAKAFLDQFGDVAEHSPWVAAETHRAAPFAGRAALIKAFEAAMRSAGHDQQLALIRAHPDLAGKAAMAGEMAEDSKKEQAGAGLDRLTADEFARFTELNGRYLKKFGFPFIFAVKGATKDMILRAFEDRIGNSADAEFEMALTQIARIFSFRLEDRVVAD